MQGIHITNEGECLPVQVRQTKKGIFCNKKITFIHHRIEEAELALISPVEPRELQRSSTPVFEFALPPPLNAYVYPTPLYIVKLNSASQLDIDTG